MYSTTTYQLGPGALLRRSDFPPDPRVRRSQIHIRTFWLGLFYIYIEAVPNQVPVCLNEVSIWKSRTK